MHSDTAAKTESMPSFGGDPTIACSTEQQLPEQMHLQTQSSSELRLILDATTSTATAATTPSSPPSPSSTLRPPPQIAAITAGAASGFSLCTRFSKTQSCDRGDDCRFAHGELELAYWNSLKGRTRRDSPVIASLQPVRSPPSQVGLLRAPQTFVLCRHYSRGFCRLGQECRFAHGVDELNHWNNVTGKPAPTQDQIKHQIHVNEVHDAQHRFKKMNEQPAWTSRATQPTSLPPVPFIFMRSNSAPTMQPPTVVPFGSAWQHQHPHQYAHQYPPFVFPGHTVQQYHPQQQPPNTWSSPTWSSRNPRPSGQ